jgi:fumarate reductase flavoprotein subunit
MWDQIGVMRTRASIEAGMAGLSQHNDALRQVGVKDGARHFNLSWHDWLNLESLVTISQVIGTAALARENSRGAHFREDFPEAGDLASSRYTRVTQEGAGLRLEMVPVSFDIVKPGESLIDDEAGAPPAAQPATAA